MFYMPVRYTAPGQYQVVDDLSLTLSARRKIRAIVKVGYRLYVRQWHRATRGHMHILPRPRCPEFFNRRRRRGGGGGSLRAPPKIRAKYFSGNYYVKFGHFSGKNHVKFGNFVNFSGKYMYHKNSGISTIFRAKNDVKFGHFVHFQTYLSGKNVSPPKVY